MKKSILIIFFFALWLDAAEEASLNLPGSNKKASKEEVGTMATLVNIYMSVRTGCSMLYQEVQYWQGINEDYHQIKDWFDRNKRLVTSIGDQTVNLFSDFELSFSYMERLENVFNDVDHLVINETKDFDAIVTDMETNWDSLARDEHTFTYGNYSKKIKCVPGLIIPNVDQTISFFEKYLPTEKIRKDYYTNKGNDTSKAAEVNFSLFVDTLWPEQKLKLVSELILSTTQARSSAYKKWSDVARYNLDKNIDPQFKNTKGVNENDLAAAYYSILEANEQNKRISHSLEETKVLSQILGIDVYADAKKIMEEKETYQQMYESRIIMKIERKKL